MTLGLKEKLPELANTVRDNPNIPFGGHKQIGLDVEYGLEGLLSFRQIKFVCFYK